MSVSSLKDSVSVVSLLHVFITYLSYSDLSLNLDGHETRFMGTCGGGDSGGTKGNIYYTPVETAESSNGLTHMWQHLHGAVHRLLWLQPLGSSSVEQHGNSFTWG